MEHIRLSITYCFYSSLYTLNYIGYRAIELFIIKLIIGQFVAIMNISHCFCYRVYLKYLNEITIFVQSEFMAKGDIKHMFRKV